MIFPYRTPASIDPDPTPPARSKSLEVARSLGARRLRRGDVVTAVNGHALTKPEAALDAYSSVHDTEVAVIEVIRGGWRIVLEVRFSPAAPRGQTATHSP